MDPQLGSWFTNYSGAYARTYTNDTAEAAQQAALTWSKGGGTQDQPTYVGIHEIQYNNDWVYVRTTGLGAHIMGPWPNFFPNFPANINTLYRIPRSPTAAPGVSLTPVGVIGMFVDGVSMFDSRDAFSYSNTNGVDSSPQNGLTGDAVWNRDAYVNESNTFDPANAHQAGPRYHYHANPTGLRYLLGDQVDYDPPSNTYTENSSNLKHSPILAWVADGYPLYGPYGYSNATNSMSGVRRMISGYQYRDGSNGSANLNSAGRTTYPAWAARVYNRRGNPNDTSLLANEYGPNVSGLFTLGHYMEDYAYKGDLGMSLGAEFDLDEHNGRWCVTPEYPGGTYAYFTAIDPVGVPVHPYNIGRTFYGNPVGEVEITVPNDAVIYFEGGPEAPSQSVSLEVGGGQITTAWFSVQGSLSNIVECSTNLFDWSPVSGGLVTNGNVITAVDALGATDTKYYRHTRANVVAPFDDTGFDHNVPFIGSEGLVQLQIDFDTNPANDPPPENTMGGNPITPVSITINGQPATFIDRPSRYEMNIEFDSSGWAPGTYTIMVEWAGGGTPFTITALTSYTVADAPRNILLLIVDDWAIDSHDLYNTNVGVSLPPTPTINSLASSGMLFTKAYAQPTCSPTRAGMLTGRYGFRTGITQPIGGGVALQSAEITLPDAFVAAGAPHALASFGKWHLASGVSTPNTLGGWPHFSGTLGGGLASYTNYVKSVNGVTNQVTQYGTTDIVDDVTAWLAAQGSDPWFCWVGFNAGHTPFHNPPTNLHSYVGIPETPQGPNRRPAYEASIEALDTEIARLLQSVDTNKTTIILLGDNGTPGQVAQLPYSNTHAKGSLYDGGGHVPFIMAGAGVNAGAVNTSVVHCVDVFSTVLELAEIDESVVIPTNVVIDSTSLVPLMTGGVFSNHVIMTENSANATNSQGRALYDGRYRLIEFVTGTNEFYDVSVDISETNDLLQGVLTVDQQTAHDALEAQSLLWQ